MTDKEKIRKEVERLKLCTMDEHMKFYSEAAEAEYNALCKVEKIIDSLQEEPVSEDLEETAEKYAHEAYIHPVDRYDGKADFIAGAKWQKIKSIVDTCYYLEIRLPEYLDYNGTKVERKDFIEDFRKALEED